MTVRDPTLSAALGPKVMQKCEQMQGKESAHGLSFLEEHIAIDAGHTLFNTAELKRLIAAAPERAEPLGGTGSRPLDTYGMSSREEYGDVERSRGGGSHAPVDAGRSRAHDRSVAA